MTNRGGWESVREAVRGRVGSSAFDAWFRELEGRLEGEALVLHCPDRFSREWIRGRYGDLLTELCSGVKRVDYRVDPKPRRPTGEPAGSRRHPAAPPRLIPQDPTFETFVVGASNALALEAARAVARGEPGPCSPLTLVGSSGVGKTHLCRAIKRTVREPLVYRSAEEFTSEVTGAMRTGQMEAVRYRYRRSLNVLILEDVQFLSGKKATQIEFFHTLDHLMSQGKRVVVSADRVPHEIEGLHDSIRSRLASGLVARIGPPELETRRAILRAKAAAGGFRLGDDCLEILATRPVEGVRDLLAGLNQVVARASLLRAQATPELVHEALEAVEVPGSRCSLDQVASVVARAYSVTPSELGSRSRKRRIVRPRQLAMYLCRRYTDASLLEIGKLFNRDHTSVRYAVETVERRVVEQPQLRYELESLATRLTPRLTLRTDVGSTPGIPRT
jgi:chromosomal replication initiator protein